MESTEFSRDQHRELDSLRGLLRNIAIVLFLLSGALAFGSFFTETPGKTVVSASSALLTFILGILCYSASVSFKRTLALEGRDPEQLLFALKDLRYFLLWLGWMLVALFLFSFFGAFALLLS
ncbi:hypothetical protein LEP1GSC047_0751 [Leptospira inadai serovar Lyme str. 10]|uniref:Uncharacterized protein n=2 Tax=Leptospira inadai serovar Lyme TaxID=293084 RepID=V6HW00_9LEPT|nr:hypothetical protein [Leptospira inadai]EQA37074.1 hypothetical protein LEP1GSC047_0751 [Leptospira inadai serovar Lyme str. 10]PNV76616.1 hypothetical protein BES34_003275 [Leptospira inadai serovar Lyme]